MEILSNDYFEDQEFNDLSLIGEKLESKIFQNCTFKNCDFSKSNFAHSVFAQCEFDSCNFSLVSLWETQLNGVIFNECKILGINFTQMNDLVVALILKTHLFPNVTFPI